MSNTEWSLSDIVGEQVVLHRKRADLTREQLAQKCADLGYPALTVPALANIETGRRDKTGRRRRDVTIEELVVLARALQIPPTLLVLPVGRAESIEALPGITVTTWGAARWFTGDRAFSQDPEEVEAFERGAAPIALFRAHDRAQRVWDRTVENLENAEARAAAATNDQDRALHQGHARAYAESLQRLQDSWQSGRRVMRQLGLTPPRTVPEELAETIDDPDPSPPFARRDIQTPVTWLPGRDLESYEDPPSPRE
jgi:transcriptional regulator with XRE-family HTH domain